MKTTLFSAIIFLATSLMSFTSVAPASNMLITLRAGTAVSLSLNEQVNADKVEIGNTVEFLVRSNVTVNGQVLIAAGSIAEGMVKDVVKSCNKCKADGCSKLVIAVETVQAVDGQNIYLRSVPLTVSGDCCCKKKLAAVANIGTKISARVQNDVKINA
ncbi:MAG: hypothetical protein AAF849_18150 [Bacteroidota bacterium]